MYSSMLQGWCNHPCLQGQGQGPFANKELSGISLTSVLAKVFDIILNYRIAPLLEAAGIPQATQTAYRDALTLGWKLQLNSRLMEKTLTHVSMIWQVPLIQSNFLFCWKIFSMLVFGGNVGDYSVTGITT